MHISDLMQYAQADLPVSEVLNLPVHGCPHHCMPSLQHNSVPCLVLNRIMLSNSDLNGALISWVANAVGHKKYVT